MARRYRSVLRLAFLLILAASLVGNLWLYQSGDQYYRELNVVRLDPLGLKAYAATPPPGIAGTRTVVFFGDSRAAEWPAPADLPLFQFINRGIGGQTCAQVAGRFEAHIAPLRPDIIVVQVGINDLKTIPLFPDYVAELVADCQAQIAQIIEQARRIQATVVLTTIFPVGNLPLYRRLYSSDAVTPAIQDANAQLMALQAPDVIVLDATALLADAQGGLRDEYRRDTLHLNAAGYVTLNQALADALRASAP